MKVMLRERLPQGTKKEPGNMFYSKLELLNYYISIKNGGIISTMLNFFASFDCRVFGCGSRFPVEPLSSAVLGAGGLRVLLPGTLDSRPPGVSCAGLLRVGCSSPPLQRVGSRGGAFPLRFFRRLRVALALP